MVKHLAFIRRVKGKTACLSARPAVQSSLFILILNMICKTRFWFRRLFCYFDWDPDSQGLSFWTAGSFHKITINDNHQRLPVQVHCRITSMPSITFFECRCGSWFLYDHNGRAGLSIARWLLIVQHWGNFRQIIKSGKLRRLTKQNEIWWTLSAVTTSMMANLLFIRLGNDQSWVAYAALVPREVRIESNWHSTAPGHYIWAKLFSTDDRLVTS